MGRSAFRSTKTPPRRSLVGLLGRLGGDIIAFLEAQLGLFRLELTHEIRARAQQAAIIAAGAVLALTALVLGSVATAFALSSVLRRWVPGDDGRHALAFLIVAATQAGVGAVLVVRGWKRGARAEDARESIETPEPDPPPAARDDVRPALEPAARAFDDRGRA